MKEKSRRYGYARVSTSDQDLRLQLLALKKAKCAEIFTDKGVSGAQAQRPGLDQVLAILAPGDALVIYKLDRLGRSTKELIGLVERLKSNGVELISLTEKIDTTTAQGTLFFHFFAAMSQFERDLIRERTTAGLEAAKQSGVTLGRPAAIDKKTLAQARKLIAGGVLTMQEVANRLGVGRSTLYRALRREQEKNEVLTKPKRL